MINWSERNGVELTHEARDQLKAGFGPSSSGEDPFDAMVGLLSMIEVVDGRRSEGFRGNRDGDEWEGWILGPELPA